MLGGLAAVHALCADGRQILSMQGLARTMTALSSGTIARAIGGALLLVVLVHAVETAKFIMAWTKYKAAVAALATAAASDPPLGDPHFVSSDLIDADLNRLCWFSTTPYLSVIVANFAPVRLVVDPRANNYFWLSCETATANFTADRAVPAESRRLVRVNACLHR
jgi:Flp pilus assembly protein TadG